MSLARALLGPREPTRARAGLVCGIAAARLTFEVELELRARTAAVAFEPPEVRGLDELLAGIADDTALLARRATTPSASDGRRSRARASTIWRSRSG